MIKIENTEVVGIEHAIRGMRNPLNSWDKSDSQYIYLNGFKAGYDIGENDLSLMKKLGNAGNDHGKFLRMITVYFDIVAPLYFLKEFDTYKVGTVANSCSTMHKIQAKEFTRDDFSCEHLYKDSLEALDTTIKILNTYRSGFIFTQDKKMWWQMIQLLPSSYNQRRTIMLNYAVLKNMYNARKAHKLDEWHDFCDWVKTLPHSELITGEQNDD